VKDSIEPLTDGEIERMRQFEPRVVATFDALRDTVERARESYENSVARQRDMKKKLRDVGVVFSLKGLPVNLYAHPTGEIPDFEPEAESVTPEPELPHWMEVCLYLLSALVVSGIVYTVLDAVWRR
jgi:hypothetical protein